MSRKELALTSSGKLILGRTASMCCSAREKTPQPPLAFSETLLSMYAASASSRGRSQCCPMVRVLLMCEQRTALPTLRCVQEQRILRMVGKSTLILSQTITFSTSFISYSYFLFSLANLQTISINSSSGSFSAFSLAILTIFVQAFLSYTPCSLFQCKQASSTTLVRAGRGIMLLLFFTSRSTSFKSSLPRLLYRFSSAVSKRCSFFSLSSYTLWGGIIYRQVFRISDLSEKRADEGGASKGEMRISRVIFLIIIIMKQMKWV